MPRGDPVDGVGVVRHLGAATRQLIAKSYRPRSGGQRRLAQRRRAARRAPPAGRPSGSQSRSPAARVERREDLAAPRVEDGEALAAPPRPPGEPAREGVERADAGHAAARRLAPSARAVAIPTRRPVKEPGPSPTAIRSTSLPAPGGRGRPLDLRQQPRRVPRAARRRRGRAATRRGPRRRAPRRRRCPRSPCRSRRSPAGRLSLGTVKTKEPDLLALDEPAHHVLAGDVRGDLVHVERSLDRFLARSAEVFLGRELDAHRVEDVGVVAAEEGALLASLLADVRGFRVLRDAAGDVVAVGGRARRGRRQLASSAAPASIAVSVFSPFIGGLPPWSRFRGRCYTRSPPSNTPIRGWMRPRPRSRARRRPRGRSRHLERRARRGARRGRRRPLDEGDRVRGRGSRRAAPGPRPRGPRAGRGRGGRPATPRRGSAARS